MSRIFWLSRRTSSNLIRPDAPSGVPNRGIKPFQAMEYVNPYSRNKPIPRQLNDGTKIRGLDKKKIDEAMVFENDRVKINLTHVKNVKYSWNPMASHNEYGRLFRSKVQTTPAGVTLATCEIEEDVHERDECARFLFTLNDPNNTKLWFKQEDIKWPNMLEALYFWSRRSEVVSGQPTAIPIHRLGWNWVPDYRKRKVEEALAQFVESINKPMQTGHQEVPVYRNTMEADYHVQKWRAGYSNMPTTGNIIFRYVVTDDNGPVWPLPETLAEHLEEPIKSLERIDIRQEPYVHAEYKEFYKKMNF